MGARWTGMACPGRSRQLRLARLADAEGEVSRTSLPGAPHDGLLSTVAHAGTARRGQALMHVDGRRAGAVTNTGIGLRWVRWNYPPIRRPASGARSFRQIRPAIDPLPRASTRRLRARTAR